MADLEYYKIRNKITGQYSTGGSTPLFAKHGKIWRAIGPVKSHLRLIGQQNKGFSCYTNCEIVIFQESNISCKIILSDVIHNLEKDLIIKKLSRSA